MKLIGLTGGVACGKTTVAEQLAKHGYPVIDTDVIARELLTQENLVQAEVQKLFGTLNRSQIRSMVFGNAAKRRKLEEILHPKIAAEVQWRLKEIEKRKPTPQIAIVVIPLLYETGWENKVDKVIAVVSDEAAQIQRLTARDHISNDLAKKMVESQLPNSEKSRRATYVIENNSTPSTLAGKVDELIPQFLDKQI